MRNRNLIIVALLLLCTQTLCSQEVDNHLDMNNMSFFKEATMVVEGRFLKAVFSYAVKDIQGKEHYYWMYPVITKRVFKGDAKAGDTLYAIRERKALMPPPVSHKIDTIYMDANCSLVAFEAEPDVLYALPDITSTRNIHAINHFLNDCVMFFKKSTFPKTDDERYAHLPQYQYLYPRVFYDEGTKLYVDGGKFGGLNDTIFNSRNDLYRFMLEAGGYDTTVVKIAEPKDPEDSAPQSRYPMIEVGPPNRDPDNSPKASCYPDKPLPPEIEKRWGKESQKKYAPDQR